MKMISFILLILSFQGFSATYKVTRPDDPVPNGCLSNDCSLREAVIVANDNPGMDDISLYNGTFWLSILGIDEDDTFYGDLDIKDDVRIYGVNHVFTSLTITVNINHFFDVKPGVNFIIEDLKILENSNLNNNTALTANFASLKLNNVRIDGFQNGGIIAQHSEVEINDSYIVNNTSENTGAGINLIESSLIMNNSFVQNNETISSMFDFQGGGIYAHFYQTDPNKTAISINNSQISGNKAARGGGIYMRNFTEIKTQVLIYNSKIFFYHVFCH